MLWSEAESQPFPQALRGKDTVGVSPLRAPVRAGRTECPRIQRLPLSPKQQGIFITTNSPLLPYSSPRFQVRAKLWDSHTLRDSWSVSPYREQDGDLSNMSGQESLGATFSFFPTLGTGLKSSPTGSGRDTDSLHTRRRAGMDDKIPWMVARSPTSNLPSTRLASTLFAQLWDGENNEQHFQSAGTCLVLHIITSFHGQNNPWSRDDSYPLLLDRQGNGGGLERVKDMSKTRCLTADPD